MSRYEMVPFRPDRRRRDRRSRKAEHDLERTQFRACGWSLRRSAGRTLRAADCLLALAVMGAVALGLASFVAVPILFAWRLASWLL